MAGLARAEAPAGRNLEAGLDATLVALSIGRGAFRNCAAMLWFCAGLDVPNTR